MSNSRKSPIILVHLLREIHTELDSGQISTKLDNIGYRPNWISTELDKTQLHTELDNAQISIELDNIGYILN